MTKKNEAASGKTYDFTNPVVQNMDADTKHVFNQLCRRASKLGDPSKHPAGRVWTEAEVIEALYNEPKKSTVAVGEITPRDEEF